MTNEQILVLLGLGALAWWLLSEDDEADAQRENHYVAAINHVDEALMFIEEGEFEDASLNIAEAKAHLSLIENEYDKDRVRRQISAVERIM